MKTNKSFAQKMNAKMSSDTFVGDTLTSKDGAIVIGTVASIGILAGVGVEFTWAVKIPTFVGASLVIFHHVFGEFNSKGKVTIKKEGSNADLTMDENRMADKDGRVIKMFGGHMFVQVGVNKWERV